MINKIYTQIFEKSPWDDLEDKENIFTKKRKDYNFNFNEYQFNFNKKIFALGLIIVLVLWLTSGIYEVKEGDEAAVSRFGRFDRVSYAGLNYHLPQPIESVIIEKVNQSRRIEIGYRSSGKIIKNENSALAQDINGESIMLTGDENIVELNVDVMWHISNIASYLFNVANPQETVKAAAESAIREVIGNIPIASVLSNQKQEITEKIEQLIQAILTQYQTGIVIEQVKLLKAEPPREVIQAYRDVQTAKADKEKEINEAQAYNNDILPRARGEAAKILQESEGYRAEVTAKAKGDTSRFDSIYREYNDNKEITKTRLYLETIDEILRSSSKIIMGGEGMLPHMAIEQPALFKKE